MSVVQLLEKENKNLKEKKKNFTEAISLGISGLLPLTCTSLPSLTSEHYKLQMKPLLNPVLHI